MKHIITCKLHSKIDFYASVAFSFLKVCQNRTIIKQNTGFQKQKLGQLNQSGREMATNSTMVSI